MSATFVSVERCWVCGGRAFTPAHRARFALEVYAGQDPELAEYSGETVLIQRCRTCGFAQPAALPALPRYFDRMYDQRWSETWIADEHHADVKDAIFDDVLEALSRRLPAGRRRLLDIGAHAGRFLAHATKAAWQAEGLELNPKTAAYAAATTGLRVHQGNAHTFDVTGVYDAVTLTDVLEHIPEPRTILRRVATFLAPGGWVAIKVPNGPAQLIKERVRAAIRPGYRATIADNLVHVNHFSAGSLARAMREEGFTEVSVVTGMPEFPPAGALDRVVRQAAFLPARYLPGAVRTPLALNLQAYGRR